MKTFSEFQESVASLSLKGGSKIVPALMTGIGAAGTIMQARRKNKKRKIGAMEKRLTDRENNVRDNDMIIAKPGEAQKQNKLIDKYTKTEEAIVNSVGGGQIAGTVEAGDDPPVKKKKKKKGKGKTYAYGGRGSRKMWMA